MVIGSAVIGLQLDRNVRAGSWLRHLPMRIAARELAIVYIDMRTSREYKGWRHPVLLGGPRFQRFSLRLFWQWLEGGV